MDRKTFDIIQGFSNIANELYFKLEKEFDMEKADELINPFDEYSEQLMKTGKYTDKNEVSNKEGFLTKKYLDCPKYLKLVVIYEYDNGYSLCETTSGSLELVPTELIRYQ